MAVNNICKTVKNKIISKWPINIALSDPTMWSDLLLFIIIQHLYPLNTQNTPLYESASIKYFVFLPNLSKSWQLHFFPNDKWVQWEWLHVFFHPWLWTSSLWPLGGKTPTSTFPPPLGSNDLCAASLPSLLNGATFPPVAVAAAHKGPNETLINGMSHCQTAGPLCSSVFVRTESLGGGVHDSGDGGRGDAFTPQGVCVLGGGEWGGVFNGAQRPPIIRHASLNHWTYYANALLYYGEDFFFFLYNSPNCCCTRREDCRK